MNENKLSRSPKRWYEDIYLVILVRYFWSHRGIKISICISLLLLFIDAVGQGTFALSILICPIWFFFSILKNAIQRPPWSLAIIRIAIPPLTLGLVLINFAVQCRIAEANAARIIAACEEFHIATGNYPKTLENLVPRYLPTIPRAKYCLGLGHFQYFNVDGGPLFQPCLSWHFMSPYDWNTYYFEDRRWKYRD
jgi:hypothetical protein